MDYLWRTYTRTTTPRYSAFLSQLAISYSKLMLQTACETFLGPVIAEDSLAGCAGRSKYSAIPRRISHLSAKKFLVGWQTLQTPRLERGATVCNLIYKSWRSCVGKTPVAHSRLGPTCNPLVDERRSGTADYRKGILHLLVSGRPPSIGFSSTFERGAGL